MEAEANDGGLLSAMTTEHFVLQTANSSTYAEASARSSLYVMALSSSLVAIGILSSSSQFALLFTAVILPSVFVLGLFTVARLVETSLESMHYLTGIARIRAYYRTLGPEAARHFAIESGRWLEIASLAMRHGSAITFIKTTASMIAVTNNVVAGAGMALLTHVFWPTASTTICAIGGAVTAMVLTLAFYAYQRWRFNDYDGAGGQQF